MAKTHGYKPDFLMASPLSPGENAVITLGLEAILLLSMSLQHHFQLLYLLFKIQGSDTQGSAPPINAGVFSFTLPSNCIFAFK